MNDAEIMARLILGNVGDETALRNICEAHNQCIDELAPEEKKHMFATNSFYYSAKEFNTIIARKLMRCSLSCLKQERLLLQKTDSYG